MAPVPAGCPAWSDAAPWLQPEVTAASPKIPLSTRAVLMDRIAPSSVLEGHTAPSVGSLWVDSIPLDGRRQRVGPAGPTAGNPAVTMIRVQQSAIGFEHPVGRAWAWGRATSERPAASWSLL